MPTTLFRKSSQVLSKRNQKGGITLMHLERHECLYALDGIAAEAWTLFDGKRPLSQIEELLVKKHRAPVQKLRKDLAALTRTLKREGLLES